MEISGVASFVKVAEHRSFSAAARDLGLSKGTISKNINKIENQLKTKLLYRTTRKLSLTETGTAFLERAVRVLEALADAECAISDLESEPSGILKINAPVSFSKRWLGPAIAAFLAKYPRVTIELTLNDRFVDLVEEGYDLAIRVGNLVDSSLIARRLAPVGFTVCASPTYLKAHGHPRRPADLATHNCLIYTLRIAPADRWIFEGPKGRETVKIRGTFHANSGEALAAAAIAGLGVLASPDFMVAEAIAAGHLVPILRDYTVGVDAAVHAVYHPSRNLSPKVRAFVDFLARNIADAAPNELALANRARL